LLTDRQTNKLWQKHNLLGGGNNNETRLKLTPTSPSGAAYMGGGADALKR